MERTNRFDPDNGDAVAALYDIVYRAVSDALAADARDVRGALQRRALSETAEFVAANLPLHLACPARLQLLEQAIDQAPPEGLVLEFGVHKGRSIECIATRLPDRTVYGFDSFEGSPEPWLYRRRPFADLDGPPDVPDNCVLVKGWFHETLGPFLDRTPGPCAFVHVDCDLHRSAKVVLEHLEPRITAGTVILFDEFFNYPGWREGEHRAFNEFIERTGATYEWIGFTCESPSGRRRPGDGASGHQVAVKILANPAAVQSVAGCAAAPAVT